MVQAHFIQMGIELCSVCRDACLGIMIMYPKNRRSVNCLPGSWRAHLLGVLPSSCFIHLLMYTMFAFLHSVPVLHRVRAIDASEVVDNPLTVRYRTRRPGGPSGIFAFRRHLKLCKVMFLCLCISSRRCQIASRQQPWTCMQRPQGLSPAS